MDKGLFTITPSKGSNNAKISVTCKKDINNKDEVTEIISIGDTNIQKTVTLNRKAPIDEVIGFTSGDTSVVKQYPTIRFRLMSTEYPSEDRFKMVHTPNGNTTVEKYIINGAYYICNETSNTLLFYTLFTNVTYRLSFEFYNRLPAITSSSGRAFMNFESILFKEDKTTINSNNVPNSEKLQFYKNVLSHIKETFNNNPNKEFKIKNINIMTTANSVSELKAELESYSITDKFKVQVLQV